MSLYKFVLDKTFSMIWCVSQPHFYLLKSIWIQLNLSPMKLDKIYGALKGKWWRKKKLYIIYMRLVEYRLSKCIVRHLGHNYCVHSQKYCVLSQIRSIPPKNITFFQQYCVPLRTIALSHKKNRNTVPLTSYYFHHRTQTH